MATRLLIIALILPSFLFGQAYSPSRTATVVSNFIDEGADSTYIKNTLQVTSEIYMNILLGDTVTVNKQVVLPYPIESKVISINLKSSVKSIIEMTGIIKVRGLFVSKYKIENSEILRLRGVDNHWELEVTSLQEYPNYYAPKRLFDFSRSRIGEYHVVGTTGRDTVFNSAFSIYDKLNIPTKTKYEGYENLLYASNQVGQRVNPYGWADNNAGDPGLVIETVNVENPYGEKESRLMTVQYNNAIMLSYFEDYSIIDSGEVVNVSFWMKMESDTTMTVTVDGQVSSFTQGVVTVSSTEWRRYDVDLVSLGASPGAATLRFKFNCNPGVRFYWDNTVAKRGSGMSFDIITFKTPYYIDDTQDVFLSLLPTHKGNVNTSDLIFPDSTYNPRVVFQQVFDYCQETENCSGLHISGVYEIDSTIFIHHAQRLESDCTIPDETFMDRDKIANSSRLEFNPPDSLPNLTFIRFDSTTRRAGTETIPKSIIIRNIYLVVMDTCAAVIELESAGMPVLKVVGIEGNDMASRGISFDDVGHAASGRTSLFPFFESVYVNNCDVGMYLEKANYLSINYSRVIGNRIGVHVVNSGRISITGTWFETNFDEDILVDRSRQFISRENYFERTTEIGTGVNYSLNFKNVSTLSFYDNTLRAASLLDGYMYLDTVRRANIIGNYYDNPNLYTIAGSTDVEIVVLSNMQNEGGDQYQPKNKLDFFTVDGNELINSKLSYKNTFANPNYISGLELRGKRQNLIINSDTLITSVTNTTDFSRLNDTIVGPFGDSISRIVYEQIDPYGSGSTAFAQNSGSPSLQTDTVYVFSFWARAVNFSDSTDNINLIARHNVDDNASSQWSLTTEWKEYSYEFTAASTSSTMMFRLKNSKPGDKFAICKGSLYKKSSGNMGYVETGATIIDDTVLNIDIDESLRFTSTFGGIGIPSMTSTQRDAITPFAGLVIYNNTTNKHQGYDGSTWNDLY